MYYVNELYRYTHPVDLLYIVDMYCMECIDNKANIDTAVHMWDSDYNLDSLVKTAMYKLYSYLFM